MIFLSHTHADKPVVEPVALRLREIFGEHQVFYDSWSIQPGDGIIDQMNKGLSAPDQVFFFVSTKSLASSMVKLEWQNALYKATHGKCKIIPVRVDGAEMPALLLQSLYLDMFSQGIEVTVQQIVNICQGNSAYTPQHVGFSNLSYCVNGDPDKEIEVIIKASHLMEPNPDFLFLVENDESELAIELNGGDPRLGGFNKDLPLSNGGTINGVMISPLGGAITPSRSMRVKFTANGSAPVKLTGVFHRINDNEFKPIPQTVPPAPVSYSGSALTGGPFFNFAPAPG